jgi:class 3 adenylate cyclase/YHS domain-containing protein
MVATLTAADLAAQIGDRPERMQEWRALGLIGSADRSTFVPADAQRAWIILHLLARGATVAAVLRAHRDDDFIERLRAQIFRTGTVPSRPLSHVIDDLGLRDTELARTLERSELFGAGTLLDDDDVQALRGFAAAIAAGFPVEAMSQLIRVYADALWRVAEAETRLFHFYVHECHKGNAASFRGLSSATTELSTKMVPLTEPAILYFHRRAWRQALLEDAMLHLQGDVDATAAELPGQLRVAVLFVDLSAFTSLADAMGDHAAVRVLERFSHVVREAVTRFHGRVVKQIGDAFMVVFTDAPSAVLCALEIDRHATTESHFPAVRSGIHIGPVLYREADYVGATVNLAARLAAAAERHQVAVTAAVRHDSEQVDGITFQPLGEWQLKGLPRSIEVFAAVRAAAASAPERLVDPVCGMELDPHAVSVRLTLEGREQAFCSEACLQRFVLTPDKYLKARPSTS